MFPQGKMAIAVGELAPLMITKFFQVFFIGAIVPDGILHLIRPTGIGQPGSEIIENTFFDIDPEGFLLFYMPGHEILVGTKAGGSIFYKIRQDPDPSIEANLNLELI